MGRWFPPSAHFIVHSMAALVAVGFNPLGYTSILQAAKPPQRSEATWPRGLQGCRTAADPASLLAQGRADLRALQGPGRRRRQAPKTSSQNYVYDEIGNLVRDYSEQIEEIVWNVQGKVQEVHFEVGKPGPSILQYEYDPMGNRLAKKKLYVDGPVDIRSEGQYYVRDPQGNVLAVYQYNEENIALVDDKDSLYLEELHLYGSARLGILKKALALRYRDESGAVGLPAGSLLKTALAQSSYQQLELGRRRYELSNHLGNVLATVSDKSLGQDSSQTGQADYYLAQVSSASLYYPFGWEMPGRKFVSGEGYRFGFNGQEEDPDMGVVFKYRVHDVRVGRFLSVDPLAPDYPWNSCYAFAENRVIDGIDLEGLEHFYAPLKGEGYIYLGHDGEIENNEVVIFRVSAVDVEMMRDKNLDPITCRPINCRETSLSLIELKNSGNATYSELDITNDELLDRANFYVAEAGTGTVDETESPEFLLMAYAQVNYKRDVNGTERELMDAHMSMTPIGANKVHYISKAGNKDLYLQGNYPKTSTQGRHFWGQRSDVGSMTSENRNAISSVIYAILHPKDDPTNGANGWDQATSIGQVKYGNISFPKWANGGKVKNSPTPLTDDDIPDYKSPPSVQDED
ncbi:YD repeat protein [Saprospira grandis str. Lewin]|uniref:YD repeat protein n=1 Tax=Saprospira grandis (strain Lewin) TaxID=984262 RepID=H6L746_SAPGL|nr:YD repeat protein [Saprospira grandis str. Lewin]